MGVCPPLSLSHFFPALSVPGEDLAPGIWSIHASPRLSVLITSDSPPGPPNPLAASALYQSWLGKASSTSLVQTDSNPAHILYVFINKAMYIYRPISMTDLYGEIMGFLQTKKKKKMLRF